MESNQLTKSFGNNVVFSVPVISTFHITFNKKCIQYFHIVTGSVGLNLRTIKVPTLLYRYRPISRCCCCCCDNPVHRAALLGHHYKKK